MPFSDFPLLLCSSRVLSLSLRPFVLSPFLSSPSLSTPFLSLPRVFHTCTRECVSSQSPIVAQVSISTLFLPGGSSTICSRRLSTVINRGAHSCAEFVFVSARHGKNTAHLIVPRLAQTVQRCYLGYSSQRKMGNFRQRGTVAAHLRDL